MKELNLKLTLLSDATLGRGDGVAGLVDIEVQHDPQGLPYLGGRTLKGLLGAECDDIVFLLSKSNSSQSELWQKTANRLFGDSGALNSGEAIMHVSPATLPQDLRQAIAQDIEKESENVKRAEILDMLTTLRRQTAIDEGGAPRKESLRTLRLIIRNISLTAQLIFTSEPNESDLSLLAATVMALRRIGTGRNRGRGRIKAELLDESSNPITETYFSAFRKAVLP
jgi:CRISPR/Cas system CSM-associated protein Csm3 (group 7 of RAMP superfamily)